MPPNSNLSRAKVLVSLREMAEHPMSDEEIEESERNHPSEEWDPFIAGAEFPRAGVAVGESSVQAVDRAQRGFSSGVSIASRSRAPATRGCNSASAFLQRSMNAR